jgi:hypothetical protein
MGEIKRIIGRARVADIDAVDQHLCLVRIRAADEHRGLAAGAAGLDQARGRLVVK